MAEETFFQTLSNGASSIKNGFNTLMNGTSPKLSESSIIMSEGISELLKYDVGRTAYFGVEIFNKGILKPFNKDMVVTTNPISYLCHTAELPGESTATVTQKIYGVTEKFAVMTGYNDITLGFYVRGSEQEFTRGFFQEWIAGITGRGETVQFQGKSIKSPQATTYNVQYKSEYAGTITITHYSITGEQLMEVTLFEAFPISINQIPLSWSAQNQAISLNVTFAYTEYSYNFYNVQGTGEYSRGPLGELIGTGIQTAATINSISGAFKSGNPIAATSTLPNLGLSNFKVSPGLIR